MSPNPVYVSQTGKQAKLTGYKDQEVINVVIISMLPGLKLHTVLETTPNLKLNRLTQYLEVSVSSVPLVSVSLVSPVL